MKITTTPIKDLLIIEPTVFEDSRGYFYESYSQKRFKEQGLDYDFVQDNRSKSCYGTLRGLHYQVNPNAQTKLVGAISGKILDVAVDLRKQSTTYGQHFSILLTANNKKQLLVPRGFAHGFAVLSDEAEFFYKCDNFYDKDSEGGIAFDDPTLDIDWQIDKSKMILSEKDLNQPFIQDAINNF